jgi:hypothetical protein
MEDGKINPLLLAKDIIFAIKSAILNLFYRIFTKRKRVGLKN